jgi:hypothetical protein
MEEIICTDVFEEEALDDMQTDRMIPVEDTDPDQMDTLEDDILSDQMDTSDDPLNSSLSGDWSSQSPFFFSWVDALHLPCLHLHGLAGPLLVSPSDRIACRHQR